MATEPRAERRRILGMRGELDARPDERVAALAAREKGVLSLDDLLACGLTHDQIERRQRRGHLHRRHRGVYVVGHAEAPLEARWLAAVKACRPTGVLAGFAAAAATGLVRWDGRPIEVLVRGAGTRVVPGLVVHRTAALPRHDVVRRDGIPMTSAPRTAVDLAAILPYTPLRRAIRQGLSLERFTLTDVRRVHARLGPRRGSANLVGILALDSAPTRSDLEDAVLDLILAATMRPPAVNVPLRLAGRRIVPDFRWADRRLTVEADGARWHDDPLSQSDDARRQALLEAHGERVLRVTWRQATERPAETIARLWAATGPAVLSARGGRAAARPSAPGPPRTPSRPGRSRSA